MKYSELAERLKEHDIKITRQIISDYIKAGLLPEPKRTARNQAIYNEEHFNRIRFIKMLRMVRVKNKPTSLKDIKDILDNNPSLLEKFVEASIESDTEALKYADWLWKKYKEKRRKLEKDLLNLLTNLTDSIQDIYEKEYLINTIKEELIDFNPTEQEMETTFRHICEVLNITETNFGDDLFSDSDLYLLVVGTFYGLAREAHVVNAYEEKEENYQEPPDFLGKKKEFASLYSIAKKIFKTILRNPFSIALINAFLLYEFKRIAFKEGGIPTNLLPAILASKELLKIAK